MEDIMIKEIQDSEIGVCAEVIRKSFLTVAEEFGLTKENCPTNGAFIESERLVAEKKKGNGMYALYSSYEMIGFIALENKNNGVYELEKLAVLPLYRHHGYGKALVDFAKNKVAGLGGNKISIGIIEENMKLRNWYSQYGFKHTGTSNYPHLPFTVGFMEFSVEL